jgi:hypothetical protein
MAKLTSKERSALPAGDFGGPDRSYPMPDVKHAENAKSRASQFADPALKAKIFAKANAIIARRGKG